MMLVLSRASVLEKDVSGGSVGWFSNWLFGDLFVFPPMAGYVGSFRRGWIYGKGCGYADHGRILVDQVPLVTGCVCSIGDLFGLNGGDGNRVFSWGFVDQIWRLDLGKTNASGRDSDGRRLDLEFFSPDSDMGSRWFHG